MIIHSIHVKNFRCIRDEVLPCEQLTILIGPNGAGKSSFLKALDLFYNPSAKYMEDDFYGKDTSKDIIITVGFTNLTGDERKLFSKYVEGDKLTVEKVMQWSSGKGSQKYYGTSLQNPEFDSFRKSSGAELRVKYNELRDGKYTNLPAYTNKEEAERALEAWEVSNPDQCIRRRDEGQFFGFKEVGEAHLERNTRFIPVPAVRDASEDAAEGRGTPLTEIMDLVVRSVLAGRKEIKELKEKTQQQYEEIVNPNRLSELQTLEHDLSNTLRTYVPDTGVNLTWRTEDAINIPMPKADIKLIEDEYLSSVERTGHGLQRAFILTMLQHLAVIQSVPYGASNGRVGTNEVAEVNYTLRKPNLIIGIEEPELYQHPNRQRNLCKILMQLATGGIKGVAECTQIIYATHSPLFVDISFFDKIRSLRKVKEERSKPKLTKVISTNLDEIAKIIEEADGKKEGSYTGQTLLPRLQTIMTPWVNEGFFANVAVLVEGTEDRAAVMGVSSALGHNFESLGVSVIPCMGKNNLDRPTAIFRKLDIKVYVIWDSDYGGKDSKPEENHRLLRLFDQPVEDYPEKITEQFTCFRTTLTKTLRAEIGEQFFDNSLERFCGELCLGKKKDAVKNPQLIQEIIREAKEEGRRSKTLEEIVSRIIELRRDSNID